MTSLAEIRASNAAIKKENVPPVSVFVGATGGIGQATLRHLVAKGFPMKTYVVGRNASAHEGFINELRTLNPAAEIIFLEGQVSLLADTRRLCDEIERREKTLDLLFLSAGFLPVGKRQETSEGIELSTATGFHSRILFTQRLLPLLNASTFPQGPRVIIILSAGWETSSIDLDDLDAHKPENLSMTSVPRIGATITSVTFDRIARANPRVTFIHNHPGPVATGILEKGFFERPLPKPAAVVEAKAKTDDPPASTKEGPGLFARAGVAVLAGVGRSMMALVGHTASQSGERSLYLVTSARFGGRGVALAAGQEPGVTIGAADGGDGALFCVDRNIRCVRRSDVLRELEDKGGLDRIWEWQAAKLVKYI